MNIKLENITDIDKNNFFQDLKDFPKQIEFILENKNIFDSVCKKQKYSNILICGMGGSAIGGDLLKSIFEDSISVPVFINRDYYIPNWVTRKTLIILSSYSGDTEETLSCYNFCLDNEYEPIIVASNGKLLKSAKENNFQFVKVPKGLMPRAALGYSLSILINILIKLEILSIKVLGDLKEVMENLFDDSYKYSNIDLDKNSSILLALKCYNKFNIIYTNSKMEVVGLRFRAQLAENSKLLSSHFIFPEQNHNEIEAFENTNLDNINILWINDSSIDTKTRKRMKITSEILSNYATNHDIEFNGSNIFIRQMRVVYFLDWVSFYCSMILNTDPYPVDKIQKLKSLL